MRSPPNNIEAEQALLGAILVQNDVAAQVGGFLTPEHFFEPIHGRVFEAITRLIDRGQVANPTTLRALFERDEAMAVVGGVDYLKRLASGAVTVISVEDYGRLIQEAAVRRQLIQVGETMVNSAYADTARAAVVQIEDAEQRLYGLAEKGRYEGGEQPFTTILAKAVENIEAAKRRDGHLTGVGTGLRDLDNRLGGLHPSDLVILAGRPSMGKTALATNIAVNAARDGVVVAFFSLEMSGEQLGARILAEETGIASERLRRGQIGEDDFLRLVQANQRIERYQLLIDDTPALSIATLRARARRTKRRHGLGLVVVDYLQLLRPATSRDNRVIEISDITQGLKALAKELDVPVLALSQLSRQVEQRDDKRPQLSDLRESGAIEQDADLVMFIFREEYYLERRRPNETDSEFDDWRLKMEQVQGIAEVIIGKHRHGPTGTVRLLFDGKLTKFANLAAPEFVEGF